MEVPVIDLGQDQNLVVQQIRRACESIGFYLIVNHGVPEEVVQQYKSAQEELFNMSIEAKMAMKADSNYRGYTPMQEETLDLQKQTEGDTKEGFYFGREIAADSIECKKPLHGPNQWPQPADAPNVKPRFVQYMEHMKDVGDRLLQLMALSLGLDKSYFEKYYSQPMPTLRPLRYSALKSQPQKGIYGAGAHCDYGVITILQASDKGLQININDNWIDVPIVPNSFIINLGDMLERWTNGVYQSTLHRVISSTGTCRYSTAFFYDPNFDAYIECIPSCCTHKPAQYQGVTYGQYLLDKYAVTHGDSDVIEGLQKNPQKPNEGVDDCEKP